MLCNGISIFILAKNSEMKRLVLSTVFTLLVLGSYGQDTQTCYQKYAKVFEARGADKVEDGIHDDVIITIRKGSFADCFVGKAKVVNGVIDKKSISLSYIDDSFEALNRAYKYEDPATITNGISKTLVTLDEELINIMFVGSIKPKKKALKRAPEPIFD